MKPDRVTGCNTLEPIPTFVYGGVAFPVVVDVPSGGFLQIIVGDNPLAIPTPGIEIPKGCMLALINAEVADAIRPSLEKAHKEAKKLMEKQAHGHTINVVPR